MSEITRCELMLKQDILMHSENVEQITREFETLDYRTFNEYKRDFDLNLTGLVSGNFFNFGMSEKEYQNKQAFLQKVANKNNSFTRSTSTIIYAANPMVYEKYIECIERTYDKLVGISAVVRDNQADHFKVQIAYNTNDNRLKSTRVKIAVDNGSLKDTNNTLIIRKQNPEIINVVRKVRDLETTITIDPLDTGQQPIVLKSVFVVQKSKLKKLVYLERAKNFNVGNSVLAANVEINDNTKVHSLRGELSCYKNYTKPCPSKEYTYSATLRLSFNGYNLKVIQFTKNSYDRMDREYLLETISIFENIPADIIKIGTNSIKLEYIDSFTPCTDVHDCPLAFDELGFILLEEGESSNVVNG